MSQRGDEAASPPSPVARASVPSTAMRSGQSDRTDIRVAGPRIDVQILAPSGNPERNGGPTNQFTFGTTTPGVCTIRCQARVTPASAGVNDLLKWTIAPVGPSIGFGSETQRAWSSPWPGDANAGRGLETTLTLTGLPHQNRQLGKKRITLTVDGRGITRTADIMVFFPRDATNHPGHGSGTTPNYFFYWNQTRAGSPDARYCTEGVCLEDSWAITPAMYQWAAQRYNGRSYPAWPGNKNVIVFTRWAPTERWSSRRRNGSGETVTGIDLFATTMRHEKQHVEQIRRCDNGNQDICGPARQTGPSTGWSFNHTPHNHGDRDQHRTDFPSAWENRGYLARCREHTGSSSDDSYLEIDAEQFETVSEHQFAREDWGDPGKNHGTRNRYDD